MDQKEGGIQSFFECTGHVQERADESNLTGTDHCVKEKKRMGKKGEALITEHLKNEDLYGVLNPH